jgi:hypothetical protein
MSDSTAQPDRSTTGISGTVAPGFEPLQEAFEANFDAHNEIGADVAVWGSHRNAGVTSR